MGEAMDQNTAWALATTRRAPTSSAKLGATAESSCPRPNTPITASMSPLNANREASIMSGSDNTSTASAYTEIMTPASASVMEKSAAMSTSRPMGMNSEVFIMNAENASPMSGSHSRAVMPPFPAMRAPFCRVVPFANGLRL